jgi:hypothetical protein
MVFKFKSIEFSRASYWLPLYLPLDFTLVSYSAYSSTLKMEAICSFETPVDFQRATRRYVPGDGALRISVPPAITKVIRILNTIAVSSAGEEISVTNDSAERNN